MAAATTRSRNGTPAEAGADPPGPRIRSLREAMGLSLRDLAERTGVSAPMLSQVERGETSPTLAVATRIAAGLELTLSQLLRLDEGRHLVITRRGRGRTRTRAGHRVEEVTPPLPGQRAELSLHVLEPGSATGGADDPSIHEPGSRETVYVQSGSVVLAIDGAEHELGAGDCVTFDADLSHHLENRGDDPAEFMAVVAAGLRRS